MKKIIGKGALYVSVLYIFTLVGCAEILDMGNKPTPSPFVITRIVTGEPRKTSTPVATETRTLVKPSETPTIVTTPTIEKTLTPTMAPAAATKPVPTTAGSSTLVFAEETIFDLAIRDPYKKALERRAKDPDFLLLSDTELNKDRLNILVFGFGETYEPPNIVNPGAIIGSPTIISVDLKGKTVALVSLTHDIRCPECEKAAGRLGQKNGVLRLDAMYLYPRVGGFPLMRKVITAATGLYPDYQIAFSDTVIGNLVDQVLNDGLLVTVPESFTAHSIFYKGKLLPKKNYVKGEQVMNGESVVQYIKSVPEMLVYPISLEHNVRKAFVISALKKAIESKKKDAKFLFRLGVFLKSETDRKAIEWDFDSTGIVVNELLSISTEQVKRSLAGRVWEMGLPPITVEKYIVDKAQDADRDEAVRWVSPNISEEEDPFIFNDFKNGVYASGLGIEVPYRGNPYGNTVSDYWGSVRRVVRKVLTKR